MLRKSPRSLSSRQGGSIGTAIAAARVNQNVYPGQKDCSCFRGSGKPISLNNSKKRMSTTQKGQQRLLHMDECDDPECLDLEQLKELQQSLDHFTDYEHYERCCDEGGRHHHHCSHGAILEDNQCCDVEMNDDRSGKTNSSTSADCADCFDDCVDCVEDHASCYEEVDVCEEDCEQCEEECGERGHGREDCPQNHPTTRDNCLESCTVPLPLLGPTDDFDLHGFSSMIPDTVPCTDTCSVPALPVNTLPNHLMEPVFDTAMDHWQTFVQTHHCAPDPCLVGHIPQFSPPQHVDPAFGFGFGCDPNNPANRYAWQNQHIHCAIPTTPASSLMNMSAVPDLTPSHSSLSPPTSSIITEQSDTAPASTKKPTQAIPQDRTCQWVMPCGSICGANFTRTEDLKKHVKNSHGVKGTVSCGWKDCSASFATEAALTGHISKKHLAFDEEGPWKCTFPSCSKSFMYKQVRDEHVASHNGGNKMHCPICHQWLNAEGSNFRRHMASHGPKHEHMKCKYEHFGCKKRFPRVDNLRRHETCCKFGKRAQGVHHHHHQVHVHLTSHA